MGSRPEVIGAEVLGVALVQIDLGLEGGLRV